MAANLHRFPPVSGRSSRALVPSAGDIVRDPGKRGRRAHCADWGEPPGRRGDAPAQGAPGADLGPGCAGGLLGSASALPVWFTSTMLALNVAVGGTMVFTLLALFAKQRQDALSAMKSAQEQAENLLVSMLPRSIAERLKAEP